MVSITLIIISVTLPIIILIIATIFVIKFSHPDDDTGYVPKIITVCVFLYFIFKRKPSIKRNLLFFETDHMFNLERRFTYSNSIRCC